MTDHNQHELNWERLADYIRAECASPDWSQGGLANAAGLSRRTINVLLSPRPKDRLPYTIARIERALGWAPGDARRILEGGEPTTADDRIGLDEVKQQIMALDRVGACSGSGSRTLTLSCALHAVDDHRRHIG